MTATVSPAAAGSGRGEERAERARDEPVLRPRDPHAERRDHDERHTREQQRAPAAVHPQQPEGDALVPHHRQVQERRQHHLPALGQAQRLQQAGVLAREAAVVDRRDARHQPRVQQDRVLVGRELGGELLGQGLPARAATSMFLMYFANALARRASMTAFLCLVVAHLECPAITPPQVWISSAGSTAQSSDARWGGADHG